MERRSSSEDAVIEQVPHYSLTTLDDGSFEKLRLIVELPGVESSVGLHVEIEGNRAFVHLPGKYRLDLHLGVTVEETPITLKFVKNRHYLKAEYKVLDRSAQPAATEPQRPRPARTPSPPSTHAHFSDAFSPRAAPNSLHDSFLAEAVKLRDAWRSSAQGARGHGAGAAKHGSRARPSARSGNGNASDGGAAEREEPSANGHKPAAQANGWQRGFLNQAASGGGGKTANDAGRERGGGDMPDDRHADSSEASSSEQWEPPAPPAADQGQPYAASAPEQERGGDVGSNLYETAKLLSNREAAAECISKAEEALAGADFDRAKRLFQKAERLAPDLYADVTQNVEQERRAREAEAAAKKKEQREAAKRRKREEQQKKQEEELRRKLEEEARRKLEEEQSRKLEEERRRKADAARAAAEEDAAQRKGRASSRGRADSDEEPMSEDKNWGYLRFGSQFNSCMNILYVLICYVVFQVGASRIGYWMQRKRFGSRQQRTAMAGLVVATWAVAIYLVCGYSLFWLRCIWAAWCFVFWRPPVTAAIIETCIFGLLCCMIPGLTSLVAVPLMWHWVGGGFAAIHGTVGCFLFVVHVDTWLEGFAPWVQNLSFLYKLASPLAYAALARNMYTWVLCIFFCCIDCWVYRSFTSVGSEDEDVGMPAGSESCKPEAVPAGAAAEVARVLQAASWYAVLDVGPSASVEEVRRAHKAKSLLTHPDKLGAQNSGAHEASIRVNTARDVLADAQKRAAYDAELRAAASAAARSAAAPPHSPPCRNGGTGPGFFTEFNGRREPCSRAAEHSPNCVCMPCKACPQWHHVYVTERSRNAAFWCNSCNRSHAGITRHVWKETTSAGFFSKGTTKVYMYVLGLVLDITDIVDGCEVWSWLTRHATGPSCRSALQLKGELPIREDCFAAYLRQQDSPADHRRGGGTTNNKRKGSRRRR